MIFCKYNKNILTIYILLFVKIIKSINEMKLSNALEVLSGAFWIIIYNNEPAPPAHKS